jgi:hypothetical protein
MDRLFSANEFFEDFMNDSPVRCIQAFERAHAAREAEEDRDQAEHDAEEEKQFQAIIRFPTPSPGSLAAESPPATNLLTGRLPETEEEEEEQLQAALVASRSSSSSFSTPSHGTSSSSISPWNHFMAGLLPPSSAVPTSKVTQISGSSSQRPAITTHLNPIWMWEYQD